MAALADASDVRDSDVDEGVRKANAATPSWLMIGEMMKKNILLGCCCISLFL